MNRISEILDRLNMTQKELAERTGMTETSISRYVTENRVPTIKNALRIAEALNVDVYYLFSLKAPEIRELETADGCDGCKYVWFEEWEMPCRICKRNSKDYWKKEEHDGEV